MDYVSIAITFTPFSDEWADIVTAQLSDLEYESFQSEDPVLKCFIPADRYVESHLKLVLDGLRSPNAPTFSFTKEFIAETNWNAVWESEWRPVCIRTGKGCRISNRRTPRQGPYPAYRLVMEPDMTFGTGHHPTTRMMISELLKLEQAHGIKGRRVMDLGCGTGILAILAAKMGAQPPVHAVDILPRAKAACDHNARRNRVPHKLHTLTGDASCILPARYDLILANIHRNVLVDEMDVFYRGLALQGHLLLSGFFTDDIPFVTEAALRCGFKRTHRATRDGWAILHFIK